MLEAKMNKSQRKHLALVHTLPCCTCGAHDIEAHHIEGRIFGRRDVIHFCTIPLCKPCHTGSVGVHGDKSMLKISRKTELEHLSETLEKLYG